MASRIASVTKVPRPPVRVVFPTAGVPCRGDRTPIPSASSPQNASVLLERGDAVPLTVGYIGDRDRVAVLQALQLLHELLVFEVAAGGEGIGQAGLRFHLHP